MQGIGSAVAITDSTPARIRRASSTVSTDSTVSSSSSWSSSSRTDAVLGSLAFFTARCCAALDAGEVGEDAAVDAMESSPSSPLLPLFSCPSQRRGVFFRNSCVLLRIADVVAFVVWRRGDGSFSRHEDDGGGGVLRFFQYLFVVLVVHVIY
jgi:hypothetical protein